MSAWLMRMYSAETDGVTEGSTWGVGGLKSPWWTQGPGWMQNPGWVKGPGWVQSPEEVQSQEWVLSQVSETTPGCVESA